MEVDNKCPFCGPKTCCNSEHCPYRKEYLDANNQIQSKSKNKKAK